MVCFFLNLSSINIAIATFSISFIAYLMRLFGIFIIPGIVIIPTIYSRYTGFGIFYAVLLLTGILTVGMVGTLAFFAARLLVEGITMLIENKSGENIGKKMGVEVAIAKAGAMYYSPVRDYINAYKLYASKFGVTVDPNVNKEEMEGYNWIHVWDDLEKKWPQVTRRFPEEKD